MGIRRYVFMSIFNCDKHPEVPLMNIKAATEQFLASSGVPHTTLRLCGFHQVSHRALEGVAVFGADVRTAVRYSVLVCCAVLCQLFGGLSYATDAVRCLCCAVLDLLCGI
jgi:hypothetical protein